MSDTDALAAEVRALRDELRAGLHRIEDRYLLRETFTSENEAMKQRVSDLESASTWLTRLVWAAVVSALLSLVIAGTPLQIGS